MQNSRLPRELALQIIKEKHSLLPAIMEEKNVPCWLVFVRETAIQGDPVFDVLVGGDVVWESAFVFSVTAEGLLRKTAIVGNFDVDAEKEKGLWDEVLGYTQGISEVLRTCLDQINPAQIALNYATDDPVSDGLSHGMFLRLSAMLPHLTDRFVSAKPLVHSLRGRKTQTELKLVEQACELAEQINVTVTAQLRVGLSEKAIQEWYYDQMDEHEVEEAWQRNSCPAVDAGPDKSFGHVGPTEEHKTKKGHSLHNDFGVRWQGYCSDLQRMWFFGKPEVLPDELRHAFDTVKTAIRRAAAFVKPGVTGEEVDNIARSYVVEQGYEEYQHALGHQVGRYAHDGGVLLGPTWERYGDVIKGKVEEGNVFTLELYVKTKNYGMVSLEEMIVVTKDGCEFIVPPVEDWIYITN